MKRILLLLLPLLLLTSCIDIYEEIIINKNGSGVYQSTIDVEQFYSMMKSMQPDTVDPAAADDSFDLSMMKSLKESAEKYRKIEGIHNVNYAKIYGTQKYRVGFEFSNVKALNEALKDGTKGDKFKLTKNTITISNPGFSPGDLSGEEDTEEGAEMAKMMLADAKYNIKVTVPKKAKSCNIKDAEINKNVVEYHTTLGELYKREDGLKLTVKYK
jgi:hypothetical protein